MSGPFPFHILPVRILTNGAQLKSMRIGYARISTDDQNLRLQLDALRRAGCARIYRDRGISAVAAERPGLARALRCLKPGDVLVVWKLDRLGRSIVHLIEVITGLRERQVGFQSLQEQIDTTSAGGRFYFHMLAALAEFERELIAERTRAGLAAAKRRGVQIGRPPKLSPAQIERARTQIATGKATVHVVARRLGVSTRTVIRAIKNKKEETP